MKCQKTTHWLDKKYINGGGFPLPILRSNPFASVLSVARNPLVNLPYVKDGDVVISQSNPTALFLFPLPFDIFTPVFWRIFFLKKLSVFYFFHPWSRARLRLLGPESPRSRGSTLASSTWAPSSAWTLRILWTAPVPPWIGGGGARNNIPKGTSSPWVICDMIAEMFYATHGGKWISFWKYKKWKSQVFSQ